MPTPVSKPCPSEIGLDSRKAWAVAFAAFVVGFVVFGIVYSFGVFLQPIIDEFRVGRASVTIYYSIASCVWYLLGPLTGYWSDRVGPRIIVVFGAAMMCWGLVATAFVGQLWQGYLTYGLGVGIGAACVYVPTLANVGGWFVRHRNAAFGLAAAGTGCGMLLVPPLAAALIALYGWRMTSLGLGIGGAVLLAACALIVSPPPKPVTETRSGRRVFAILSSREFILQYVSWVLATTALFIPFVFLPQYAVSIGVGPLAASLLLSILGGVSVIGRIGIGFVGDRIGSLRLFKLAVFLMATSHLIWLMTDDYPWLVVFTVWLGLAYGVRIALLPGVLIDFFGTQNLGSILGVFLTATGLASLFGPLMAGYAMDNFGDYRSGIALALALGLAGFLVILPLVAPNQDGVR